jgi:hypothetical protein
VIAPPEVERSTRDRQKESRRRSGAQSVIQRRLADLTPVARHLGENGLLGVGRQPTTPTRRTPHRLHSEETLLGETKKARHLNFCYQASIYGSGDADLRKNLISPRECFLCGPDAAKEIPHDETRVCADDGCGPCRRSPGIGTTATRARAVGPLVTKPTTQR